MSSVTLWLVVVLFYGGGSATLRAYHLDATVSFDGKTQLPIVIAESAGHIGELIRTAAARGMRYFPWVGVRCSTSVKSPIDQASVLICDN